MAVFAEPCGLLVAKALARAGEPCRRDVFDLFVESGAQLFNRAFGCGRMEDEGDGGGAVEQVGGSGGVDAGCAQARSQVRAVALSARPVRACS
ncbi:hypothetical protein GCM10029992_36300 [Glycomyces albus]